MSWGKTIKRGLRRLGVLPDVRRSPPDPLRETRRLKRIRAENARDAGDWAEAARFYGEALEGDQDDVSNRVQYGHALKECGRLAEAEAAYRRAISLRPADADTYLHLGHVLKMQHRPEDAKQAYADALAWSPDLAAARDELIGLGGRGRLPHHAWGRDAATERLGQLGQTLAAVRHLAGEWRLAGSYPVQAWDAFRRDHPLTPPPAWAETAPGVHVIVNAADAPPSDLRATLHSLLNQAAAEWTAVVVCGPQIRDHPVAGLASRDARISFDHAVSTSPESPRLLMEAGVVLEPYALAWLTQAWMRTGALAVYADHDSHSRHWREGRACFDPALYAAPDADDLATTPVVPSIVLTAPSAVVAPPQADVDARRSALVAAARQGAAAHLPRVLSSVWRDGPAADLPFESGLKTESPPGPEPLNGRILVVIPTRDAADMLRACVDSLIAKAAEPERVELLIVDNRSQDAATAALLADWAASGRARVVTHDEPFNWARINNRAVAGLDAAMLVFANNDVEALSSGWDARLRQTLARPEIGLVGARLLYPDGTLQHAGVVLGRGEGRPIHEGLHSRPGEPGPLARWIRPRAVAAVTGAFMAVRREVFELLGGFDEGLAVGYNDMDLCLKARAQGLRVLYDPALVLTHHESKTRGFNDGGERTRWDDDELTDLHRRWGQALFTDMSLNPQWVSAHSRVFDGYRDLGPRETIEWLMRSARPDPWRILDEDREASDGASRQA